MALTLSGHEPVVRLVLPAPVYLNARSPTLDDVRVFDAAGTRMPFTIAELGREQPATVRASRALPVHVFPVLADAGQGVPSAELEVRSAKDGTVLSVTTRASAGSRSSDSAAPLSSLILDLGADGGRNQIDALRLTVKPGTSYSARVALEVSDDLRHWDAVGEAELNWLVNQSADTLASDRIAFEPRAFRYARLSWIKGTPLLFPAIQAEVPSQTEQRVRRDSVVLHAGVGRFANDLVYRGSVAMPVTRIGLAFPEQNTVLPGRLGHYVQVTDTRSPHALRIEFEPLVHATFYQLQQGGAVRSSGDLTVSPMHVNEWVLRPDEASSVRPDLRLAWTPAMLVFLANGHAPYTLAFGHPRARPATRSLAQVAPGFTEAEIAALPPATAGQLTVRQVQNDATADTQAGVLRASHTRAWLLWGVLLLGVGVLAFMASRLVRQMKSS